MELLKVVMLSSWNSISGPRIEHLWLPKTHPVFCSSNDIKWNVRGYDIQRQSILPLNISSSRTIKHNHTVQQNPSEQSTKNSDSCALLEQSNETLVDIKKCLSMSGKLLITEIESRKAFTENSSRLYCLDNEILFSLVFHKHPWLESKKSFDSHCSCISLLLNCHAFSLSYDLHRIIDLHFRKIVLFMQRSTASPLNVAKEISPMIEEICEIIYCISSSIVPSTSEPSHMPLIQQFQHQMGFLSQAIASHIQTCGYSVVNGDSAYMINKVARILLLFNSEQEKLCSEANLWASQNSYHSGFHVQAILKKHNEASLPSTVYRDYPVTFIDTDWYKVRQTLSDSTSEYNSNLLKTVTESGTLIPQLLEDLIFFEENNSDIRTPIKNFCKFLMLKAVALMKVINKFRSEGQSPTEKQLMILLNVKETADLHVCLGCAEKIKPGIRTALA